MTSTTTNGRTGTRSRSSTKKSMSDLEMALASKEQEDDKVKKVKKERKAKIQQDVAAVTFDKVAQAITNTELNISKALQGVNIAVKEQVELLENLRAAKAIVEEEIEELHGKELIASAIDVLILEHNEKKEVLEAEISQKKTDWEKEKKLYEESIKQRNDQVAREWEQEKLDHEFELRSRERAEAEKALVEEKARKAAMEEYEYGKKKEWKEREVSLQEREKRAAELEQIEATLEERLAAAREEARKETTSKLIPTHQNELKFAKMELEGQIKSKDQTIQSLESQLADSKNALAIAQKEISNLQTKVENLAAKAMDAASGKQALEAVQNTLQNQSSGKGK